MKQEILDLIEIALADGQVSDKERNVIRKKAIELGVDPDEVEMVLDGKLHQLISNKPKEKEKSGNLKICPSCGASIPPLTGNCKDCGHEFINTERIKIISEFSEGYNSLLKSTKNQLVNCPKCKNSNTIINESVLIFDCAICGIKIENTSLIRDLINYIKTFNVPYDKENLLSFASFVSNNYLNVDENNIQVEYLRDAIRDKLKEIIAVLKTIYPNDHQVVKNVEEINQNILNSLRNSKKIKNKYRNRRIVAFIIVLLILFWLLYK